MKNLKRLPTVLVATFYLLLFSFSSSAQNVGINETGAAPDGSALLDLKSESKGFLITRADTVNISSPAFGLMTLSPSDSCLYMQNGEPSGKTWISLGGVGYDCPCGTSSPESGCPTGPSNLAVGDLFEGGIVFEVSPTGTCQTGKVVSLNDIGTLAWGGYGTATGASSATDGATNTTTIIGVLGNGSYAAFNSRAHSGGGHTDWYLPAIEELIAIYTVKSTVDTGLTGNSGTAISNASCWSSTEINSSNYAFLLGFSNGGLSNGYDKNYASQVRAVRAF